MTKAQAISYYGSQVALAKAIGVSQASVSEWGKYPPPTRQLQLHKLTGGALRAEKYILKQLGVPA